MKKEHEVYWLLVYAMTGKGFENISDENKKRFEYSKIKKK